MAFPFISLIVLLGFGIFYRQRSMSDLYRNAQEKISSSKQIVLTNIICSKFNR